MSSKLELLLAHQRRKQEAMEAIEIRRPLLGEEFAEKTVDDYGGNVLEMLKAFDTAVNALAIDGIEEDLVGYDAHLGKEKVCTQVATEITPSSKGEVSSAQYLALEEKRKKWSWFQSSHTAFESRQQFINDWSKDPAVVKKQLQERFRTYIKAGKLTSQQAVTLLYVLYADAEFAPFMMADWMMSPDPNDVVTNHNWYMVDELQNAQWFKEKNGAKIMNLTLPIFPEQAHLEAINLDIIESGTLSGGGGHRKLPFKKTDVTERVTIERVKVLKGGGQSAWVPVRMTENGEPYVDLSHIENWSIQTDNRVGAIQNEVKMLKGQAGKPQQGYQRIGYQPRNYNQRECFKCRQPGHIAAQCNAYSNNYQSNTANNGYGNNSNSSNYQSNNAANNNGPPPDFRNVPSSGTVIQ